jgi:hypothetical protein
MAFLCQQRQTARLHFQSPFWGAGRFKLSFQDKIRRKIESIAKESVSCTGCTASVLQKTNM